MWHILYWCGADDPSSVNLNIGSGVLVTLVMFLGVDDPGSITIWYGGMVAQNLSVSLEICNRAPRYVKR